MDYVKKLTSKNQSDFELAANHIIDNAEVSVFSELVEKDDFIFDFIKQNVAKRLEHACNRDNYSNLLKFLNFYSPSYEDFIARVFAKFADEKTKNELKNLFLNGTIEQKTYVAKYYAFANDESVIDKLTEYAFEDNEALALNSAFALSSLGDRISVNIALDLLNSDDDFKVLSAVKFLSVYGEKSAINIIFDAMKKSSVAEYIACEIGYLESFISLLNSNYYEDALLALINILNGLGEIVAIRDIFTFQLYEVFEYLMNEQPNSKNITVLLTAQNKFNQLTENDEYLFDEDKNTKDEVYQIKKLLNDNLDDDLINLVVPELNENSPLVYSALDLVNEPLVMKPLLTSTNQTLLLKVLEVLKSLNSLEDDDKNLALNNVIDENIKSVILAL